MLDVDELDRSGLYRAERIGARVGHAAELEVACAGPGRRAGGHRAPGGTSLYARVDLLPARGARW